MKGKCAEIKDFDTRTKNFKTFRIRWSKRAYIIKNYRWCGLNLFLGPVRLTWCSMFIDNGPNNFKRDWPTLNYLNL